MSKISYCQTLGLILRLRVDFVLPLSQEEQQQQEQEQEQPPPKYTRMKHPRSLKFDT